MSTRSLTVFYNTWIDEQGKEKNKAICAMYRQSDGYMSGHGVDLRDNFGNFKLINGIGVGDDLSKNANGMDCLAAQVIAHFKVGIGSIYMSDPKNYQAYNYHLYEKEGRILVKVYRYGNKGKVYEGWLLELPSED